MRLDVLIPSKNRAAQLAASRPSVMALARRCGATVRICDQSRVAVAWPDAQVLHRPDLSGLPAARNALLAASDADVAVFLDDDSDPAADLGSRVLELAAREPHIAAWGPVVEARGRIARRLHRLLHLGCMRD
ncbi:MAG: glycosyltransferase, partial [Planctomycetes bacterium]|nr:glycosyltransferase [Planctomycetota bacterium]